MLNSIPAWKKYTTAGCDEYEVCCNLELTQDRALQSSIVGFFNHPHKCRKMFWVIWLTNRVFWVTKKVFWIRNRVFSAIWLMVSIFSIFSLFSKIAPCSPIRCGRIPQFVEPCLTGLSSPGLRAESARAVTGRRWPTPQWGGGRLFEPSTGFFMKTAVTESRKIDPKVGN